MTGATGQQPELPGHFDFMFARPVLTGSTAPSYPGDFPDPFVLRVGTQPSETVYYAYSTGSGGRNLQVFSSPDFARWTDPIDPLPLLPPWASAGRTWAPGVLALPDCFVMYYTVRDRRSGRQCISVATAATPTEFTDASDGPLVCQLDRGGSIDPCPFVDGDGTPYLLWKSEDNAFGQPTNLWAQRLSADGLTLVGHEPTHLLRASEPWQRGIIEGPCMAHAQGVYYLFYGAGNWSSANAGIGYATCSSPLGTCTNRSRSGPWLGSCSAAAGPSGPAVFTVGDATAGSDLRLAYHAWQDGVVGYDAGGVRDLWIDTLTFAAGRDHDGGCLVRALRRLRQLLSQ